MKRKNKSGFSLKQRPLFADHARSIPVNNTVDARATPRLSGQCSRILERLRAGTVSNKELSAIALKYTSRISDLRAVGYKISKRRDNQVIGQVIYQLDLEP